jgi:hypothetical protein
MQLNREFRRFSARWKFRSNLWGTSLSNSHPYLIYIYFSNLNHSWIDCSLKRSTIASKLSRSPELWFQHR